MAITVDTFYFLVTIRIFTSQGRVLLCGSALLRRLIPVRIDLSVRATPEARVSNAHIELQNHNSLIRILLIRSGIEGFECEVAVLATILNIEIRNNDC